MDPEWSLLEFYQLQYQTMKQEFLFVTTKKMLITEFYLKWHEAQGTFDVEKPVEQTDRDNSLVCLFSHFCLSALSTCVYVCVGAGVLADGTTLIEIFLTIVSKRECTWWERALKSFSTVCSIPTRISTWSRPQGNWWIVGPLVFIGFFLFPKCWSSVWLFLIQNFRMSLNIVYN